MIDLFAAGPVPLEKTGPAALQSRESSPQAQQPIPLALSAARLLPGPTMRTVAAAAAVMALTSAVRRRGERREGNQNIGV